METSVEVVVRVKIKDKVMELTLSEAKKLRDELLKIIPLEGEKITRIPRAFPRASQSCANKLLEVMEPDKEYTADELKEKVGYCRSVVYATLRMLTSEGKIKIRRKGNRFLYSLRTLIFSPEHNLDKIGSINMEEMRSKYEALRREKEKERILRREW
ncbi:MAG: hypothetical protein DRP01_01535 [Archaeoglobales archaeon]|nr:MAG: hypothetical protein DRP01_01535 [Archaeoglobales archaeon]